MDTVTWGTVILDPELILASGRRLALWLLVFEVTWWDLPDVLGTSLEAVITALLPVPPPLPVARTWRGVLARLALVADGCLDLVGRLGRWSVDTLLLLPSTLLLPPASC